MNIHLSVNYNCDHLIVVISQKWRLLILASRNKKNVMENNTKTTWQIHHLRPLLIIAHVKTIIISNQSICCMWCMLYVVYVLCCVCCVYCIYIVR